MRTFTVTDSRRHGVFTTAEARSIGLTSSALRHAVATGRCRRLRPGVFAADDGPAADRFTEDRRRNLQSAIAAGLCARDSVLSHSSAAIFHQLALLDVPTQPCLTMPVRSTRRLTGVHLHEPVLSAERYQQCCGFRVTDVARTVVDVGRELGPAAGLVTADAALHDGLTTPTQLAEALAECRGWPGMRSSRRALDLADGRAESPLESLSRFALSGHVPAPELQSSIHDLGGRFLGRVDMLWSDVGVAGEADGWSSTRACREFGPRSAGRKGSRFTA